MEGSGTDDWALERESELIRLEYENYELRHMLGMNPPMSPETSPLDFPTRLEVTAEGDQQQRSGLGMFTGPRNPEPGDDLALRRQPSHTQGQTQISLEGPQHSLSQTQPLHIAFPPDAPLVTRKYGRRAGSGSGSFISGGGSFMSTNGGGETSTSATIKTGPFGTFRTSLASGSNMWQDNATFGPGERNMNVPLPGQEHETSTTGREGNLGDVQEGWR